MKKDIKHLIKKYNLRLDKLKKQGFDLVVFRCDKCARDLENYNPYTYSNGTSIPLNKIKVVTTLGMKDCENLGKNIQSKPQKCAPIVLYNMEQYV